VAHIQLEIDADTYESLVKAALAERRPVPWQAEIVLRRALGLPVSGDQPTTPQLQPVR